MRASPFSSIRRITRDLRQPSVISGTHSVFQSSPLNPRAESLMQRKRRASNATQITQMSRPQSVIGHHLAVPGTITSITGPTPGAYSTLVMGPNGSQIRVQLCEIVVADEKNETTRYQVFRPILPHGDLSHTNAGGDMSIGRAAGILAGTRQPFIGPRGSMLSDSRASSVRFENVPSLALEENEKNGTARGLSSKGRPSPISGSMFIPPKLSVSPPSPPSSPTSNPAASSHGPAKGLFPRHKFRSPSTSTAASGDIMEINDPGHARTVVSIEPVQQQPLYSLYIPPPVPHVGPKSVPSTASQTQAVIPIPATISITSASSDSSTTANVSNVQDTSHEKESSQDTSDGDESHGTHDTTLNMSTEDQDTDDKEQQLSAKSQRSLFGRLFGTRRTTSADPRIPSAEDALSTPTTLSIPTSTPAPEPVPESAVISPPQEQRVPTPVMFNRTNHPTRISEGEEEEDLEDLKEVKTG
ncbi:MAG: hypothetical protein J3Q66DRAFT_43430 [Benniella sp.]|nr:MAG: hypothetical protein J3Q66DRAFT_43430 [Benniella sp.]